MKRILVILLSGILMVSLAVTVWATGNLTNAGTSSQPVQVNDCSNQTVETVYSVDIKWGSMVFNYYGQNGSGVWNPETHQYSNNQAWAPEQESANEVTITNHSNVPISYRVSYTADSEAEGAENVEATVSNDAGTLPTAVGKDVTDTSLTAKSSLSLSGNYSGLAKVIGTLNVAIQNGNT